MRIPARHVVLTLAFSAALVSTARSAVTLVSHSREVMTFATLDLPEGVDPVCSDQKSSALADVFDEATTCEVGQPESGATGTAAQLSYITPQSFLAEGNISGHASIANGGNFAEGFGAASFLVQFAVDQEMEIHLQATLVAQGDGHTGIVLRVAEGQILVLHDIQNETRSIDQRITLAPAVYDLNIVTSGFGQATVFGETPAFGSFSTSLSFPLAAGVVTGPARGAPIVAPNPIAGEARIVPALAPGRERVEVTIVDLSGRVVRRLGQVGAEGASWDTRDDAGRSVPAGVYWARAGSAGATRALVLR